LRKNGKSGIFFSESWIKRQLTGVYFRNGEETMNEIPRRHVLKGAVFGGLVWAQVRYSGKLKEMNDVEGRPIQRVKDPNAMTDLEKEHMVIVTVPSEIVAGEPFKISMAMPNHPMLPNHHVFWMRTYLDNEAVSFMTFAPTWQRPEATITCTFLAGDRLDVVAECNLHGLWGAYTKLNIKAPAGLESTATVNSTGPGA
jgi:desulfoferrodoxin-like iron-binding protein